MSDNKTIQQVNDLMYENMNDILAWGKLGGVRVLIYKPTGVINCPQLAKDAHAYDLEQYAKAKAIYDAKVKNLEKEEKDMDDAEKKKFREGQGIIEPKAVATIKKFNDWSRQGSNKQLSEVISGSTGIPVDRLIVEILNVPNDFKGTYMHPKLAVHYAQWLSKYFAVFVSEIILDYAAQEIRIEKARLEVENLSLTDRLKAMELRMEQNTTKMFDKLDNLSDQNNGLKLQNNELKDTLDEVKVNNEILHEKVNIIAERFAVKAALEAHEMVFMLLRKHVKGEPDVYYVIRGQYKNAIKKYNTMKDNGYRRTMYFLDPNPINLVDRIRQDLYKTRKIIDMSYNDITLCDGVKKADLVKAIEEIRDQKYKECQAADDE